MNVSELIMLALGIGTLLFLFLYRNNIKRILGWQMLVTGFSFLVASWIFTNLETWFLENILNFLEHLFNATGVIIFALWSLKSVPAIKGRSENE